MTPSIDGRVFDRNQRTGLIQNRVVKSVSHCGEAFTSAVSTRLSMPVNTSVPKTMRRTPNPIFMIWPAARIRVRQRCIASRAGGDPPLEARLAIYRHHHALIVFIDRDEERRRLRNADKSRARCAHGSRGAPCPTCLPRPSTATIPTAPPRSSADTTKRFPSSGRGGCCHSRRSANSKLAHPHPCSKRSASHTASRSCSRRACCCGAGGGVS